MVSKKDYSGCAAISFYPVQKECTEGSCSTNALELKSEYVYHFFLSNLSLVSTQILRTKKTTLLQCPYKTFLKLWELEWSLYVQYPVFHVISLLYSTMKNMHLQQGQLLIHCMLHTGNCAHMPSASGGI